MYNSHLNILVLPEKQILTSCNNKKSREKYQHGKWYVILDELADNRNIAGLRIVKNAQRYYRNILITSRNRKEFFPENYLNLVKYSAKFL